MRQTREILGQKWKPQAGGGTKPRIIDSASAEVIEAELIIAVLVALLFDESSFRKLP